MFILEIDAMEQTTALFAACFNGHIPIIDYLLSQGADINAPEGKFGISPLMVAALNGYEKVVDFLLSKEKERALKASLAGTTSTSNSNSNSNSNIGKSSISFDESSGMDIDIEKEMESNKLDRMKPLDVDWQGADGATALIYAANDGKIVI